MKYWVSLTWWRLSNSSYNHEQLQTSNLIISGRLKNQAFRMYLRLSRWTILLGNQMPNIPRSDVNRQWMSSTALPPFSCMCLLLRIWVHTWAKMSSTQLKCFNESFWQLIGRPTRNGSVKHASPKRPRTWSAKADSPRQCHWRPTSSRIPPKEANEYWIEFSPKLWEARSRLYRRRFLQVNTCWKALDEIYKIRILLHRSDFKISVKNRQTFFENE